MWLVKQVPFYGLRCNYMIDYNSWDTLKALRSIKELCYKNNFPVDMAEYLLKSYVLGTYDGPDGIDIEHNAFLLLKEPEDEDYDISVIFEIMVYLMVQEPELVASYRNEQKEREAKGRYHVNYSKVRSQYRQG